MKKNIYFSAFAASLLAMGFTSCSNEDFAGVQQENGTVRMTVGISKADLIDGETRTSLSENSKGDLDCVWEADDRIMVSSTDGKQIHGYLTVLDGVGESFAHFSCENLVGLTDNTKNLTFTYLGRAHNSKDFKGEYESFMYTKQEGTMSSLSNQDLLVGKKVAVSVADGEAYAENISLQRPFAFGHFTLVFPEGVKRTSETVTISGTGIQNMVTYRPDGSIGLGANGGISINGNTGNDLYVIFPLQNTEAITPTFTVTVGGKDYSATLTERTWKAGEYVRKAVNEGVPVVMETDEEEVDHSKNPLLKWAKTNLDLSQPSGFAAEQWDRGQLFQFGRNCGYTDYRDAQNRYAVYCSVDTSYPWNTWGFNVYNGNATGAKVTYSYSKTGLTDTNPDEYFWIADTDLGATNNDWWPKRASLGDTWSTRATAEGWTTGDPSPEGWHLATTAEYEEIMPKQYSSSTQSNVFGKGEIRENGNCTYAIRWDITKKTISTSNVRYVLAVKCLVVEKGTSYSQVDWNDENVVVRNFPAAGYINSGYTKLGMWYYGNNTGLISNYHTVDPAPGYSQFLGYQRNAKPVPVGLISYVPTKVNSTSVAIRYRIDEDHSNFRTSYWTADGDCFGFSYDLDKQWSDPYFIGMHKSYQKTFAMPLRCVKD